MNSTSLINIQYLKSNFDFETAVGYLHYFR